MFRYLAFAACALGVLRPTLLHAQAAPPPAINVVAGSVDETYADLKWLFEAAGEPKAWTTLKQTLDVFVVGIDPKQPIVIEYKASGSDFKRVAHFPVSNLKDFLANMRALDVKTKKEVGAPDLYKVSGLVTGFLAGSKSEAVIGEERTDITTKLTPTKSILAAAPKGKHDLAVFLKNDAAQQPVRQKAMDLARKEIVDSLKALKTETKEEFAIRKLFTEQQFAELERFYVEGDEVTMQWETSPANKVATMDFVMSGLPGTVLEKSVALVAKDPSFFAAIPLDPKAVLSGQINFPLDDLRKKHLQDMLKLTRPEAQEEIEKQAAYSAEDKKLLVALSDFSHDLWEEAARTGVLDGYILAESAGDKKYQVIGGAKIDGAVVVAALGKLKDAGFNVAIKTEEHQGFEIHTVDLPKEPAELQTHFGKGEKVYVATSKDAALYAIGGNAQMRLKATLGTLAAPPAAPAAGPAVGVAFHGQVGPWLSVINDRRLVNKKGDAALRKVALAALEKGDDRMDFTLVRNGNKIEVKFVAQHGLLRAAGAVMAKFVKDTL